MGKVWWGLGTAAVAGIVGGGLVMFGVVAPPVALAGRQVEPPVLSGAPADQIGDFMARVLGSTEEFWAEEFRQRRLPTYGTSAPTEYTDPILVLYDSAIQSGCGGVAAEIAGPVFCSTDHKLYIDTQFYEELAKDHHAPGDFAQAYVIAHEVAHHVQDLIGAGGGPRTESENRQSVRYELQADCFAGAWTLGITKKGIMEPGDLEEGIAALTNIGDDILMRTSAAPADPATFTHGTGAQRVRWFRRGYAGDARDCDTFTLAYEAL